MSGNLMGLKPFVSFIVGSGHILVMEVRIMIVVAGLGMVCREY